MARVLYKYGTRAQYDALLTKDDNALYFLTDTGEIYRGATNLARGRHFEAIFNPETDTNDNDVFARVLQGKYALQDDIFVVQRLIPGSENKYSYTSYIYDGQNWKAMDGNYSASNVYLEEDIVATTTVGTITELTNGSATFAVKGMTVQEALKKLLAEEKEPTIDAPTYTLSASATIDTGKAEIGNYITAFNWNGTWSAGSYQYGSKENTSTATGITATYAMSNNKDAQTSTALDSSFTLADADKIQITTVGAKTYGTVTGVATYIDSPYTPVTNLGSAAKAGSLKGSSITKTASVSVTGYRNSFYGVYTAKEVDGVQTGSTAASIRSLTASGKTLKNGDSFEISIPADAQRVVIAYPATLKDLDSVLDKNDSNANIVSAFTKEDGTAKATLNIPGANGYDPVSYKIFSTDFAGAYGAVNTFTVKIKA